MEEVMKLLTAEDKDKIDSYITDYAHPDDNRDDERRAPIEDILSPWAASKSGFLGAPFIEHNTLIFKEYVEYMAEINEIIYAIDNDRAVRDFIYVLESWYHDHWKTLSDNDKDIYDCVWSLLQSSDLAQNKYTGPTRVLQYPNDPAHKLTVPTGCKPVKMLGKINQLMFHLDESFENFRLAHSRILNSTKLHGQLCISIHPLDYMTMSDNDCDWDSCMSWVDEGSYRLGTVEMMNSPSVVVAYLESSTPMWLPKGVWNNKKWRCLFIVTPDVITSIKGYPYNSNALNTIVIEKLRKLYNTETYTDIETYKYHGNSRVSLQNTRLIFRTGHMYNDFGTTDHDGCINVNNEHKDIYVNYSGYATCMWCGENLESDTEDESLLCSRCLNNNNSGRCEDCGSRVNRDELVYLPMYDIHVCPDCLCEYYRRDYCLDEYYRKCDVSKILIIPKEYWEEYKRLQAGKLNANDFTSSYMKKWAERLNKVNYVYVHNPEYVPTNIFANCFGETATLKPIKYLMSTGDFYIYEDEIPSKLLKYIEFSNYWRKNAN